MKPEKKQDELDANATDPFTGDAQTVKHFRNVASGVTLILKLSFRESQSYFNFI